MSTPVQEDEGFVRVDEDRGPTLRESIAQARENHRKRMEILQETAVAVVRPKWVVHVPWTAAERKADHWQLAVNVAFAIGVLLNMCLVARGLLITTAFAPLTPIVGLGATFTVLKLVRLQLHREGGGKEPVSHYHRDDDEGSYCL